MGPEERGPNATDRPAPGRDPEAFAEPKINEAAAGWPRLRSGKSQCFRLPEQLQDGLSLHVGLSHHRRSRLREDLVAGEAGHLLRHVRVADA